MDSQVTLRPVIEEDLPWLASLRNDPAATGLHEWHGWRDPQVARRRWAASGDVMSVLKSCRFRESGILGVM